MAALGRRVTVGDVAVKLNSAETDNMWSSAIDVKNPAGSGPTVDLGGAGVVSGAGYELAPGSSKSFALGGDDLYAIAPAAQSVDLEVLELGI